MRAIFLADGKVFTTGFSRMSERQLALWDPVSGRDQPKGAGLRLGLLWQHRPGPGWQGSPWRGLAPEPCHSLLILPCALWPSLRLPYHLCIFATLLLLIEGPV